MTFPSPATLGLGNGYSVTTKTAADCAAVVHRHALDAGDEGELLDMLGLADDDKALLTRRRKLTSNDVRDLLTAFDSGEHVSAIAKRLNVSPGAVYHHIHKHRPDAQFYGRNREHGTHTGYRQHQRAGETSCDPCAQAWRAYNREWQQGRVSA